MVNAYKYLSSFLHFNKLHQSTNNKGQRQSAWYTTVSSNGEPINNCLFYTINQTEYQLTIDSSYMFGISNGEKFVIVIMNGDGTTPDTIPLQKVLNQASEGPNSDMPPEFGQIEGVKIKLIQNLLSKTLIDFGVDSSIANQFTDYYAYVYSFIGYDYNNMSFNSTPVFNANDTDSIKKYVETGEITNNILDYSVNWTFYLSDDTAPQIKVVWKSPVIEQLFRDGEDDCSNVYVNLYTYDFYTNQKIYIEKSTYCVGNLKTSFVAVAQINKPVLASSIQSNAPLDGNKLLYEYVTIYAELQTQKGYKSECYVKLNYVADVESYGMINNNDKSTVTIIKGSGDDNDGYVPPVSDVDVGNETSSTDGYSSLNLLSTTYKLTKNDLLNLSSKLWSRSFIETIFSVNTSPIENIIACKIIPYSISGSKRNVILGNYDTLISSEYINNNIKIDIGTINIDEYYNSFLDYSPYTKITIFIPYIGFKELDTSQFMGKSLKIEYVIDIITASCKALLFSNGIYIQSFDGQCGIDIPISASNRAEVEASYITGALGAIGEMSTGNIGGAISTGINTAMTPYHYNTQGAYNPSCGSYETKLCYLIIDRPTAQYPSSYGHDIGYPCNLTCNVSKLRGYTVFGDNIDMTGCQLTESEKTELQRLLSSGVYL